MILYLHGFRSSPLSWKARLLGEAMAARGLSYACPALSHVPEAAMACAEAIIATAPEPVTLVGSSLGGFYATWLAEKHGLRAVLVNPAVLAPLSLTRYIGTQTWMYSQESFEFTAEHIEQLRGMEVPTLNPARYLLLVEEGDEVLDCREAVKRYAGATQVVLPGGDHSFTQFPKYISQIIEFSQLITGL